MAITYALSAKYALLIDYIGVSIEKKNYDWMAAAGAGAVAGPK